MANETPDVLGAVNDFLLAYVFRPQEAIVRGWQNRAALPNATDYAVLTLIGAIRHGTNVHEWTRNRDGGFIEYPKMLVEYAVQVDFCGLDEHAVSKRAWALALLGRDALAVEFFQKYGLSALYAEDPQSLPFGDDTSQWCVRYKVDLHLSAWNTLAIPRDDFSSVDIYLENVDVHHPIKNKELK